MKKLLVVNLNKQINKFNYTSTISAYDCPEQEYYFEILYLLKS